MMFYQFIFLIFAIAPLSTFFHELGHALAAKQVKAEVVTLRIGKGKQLFRIEIRELQIEIFSLFFMGGHTVSSRSPSYKLNELIYITLLGPLLNGIIAFLLILINRIEPFKFIELAIWFNLWLFFVNMIPIRIKDKHTDGYIVYKLLWKQLK